MSKANQKATTNADMQEVNKNYDRIKYELEKIADSCETIMPLVSSSLKHTIKCLKLYKDAFNAGVNNAPKRQASN